MLLVDSCIDAVTFDTAVWECDEVVELIARETPQRKLGPLAALMRCGQEALENPSDHRSTPIHFDPENEDLILHFETAQETIDRLPFLIQATDERGRAHDRIVLSGRRIEHPVVRPWNPLTRVYQRQLDHEYHRVNYAKK